MSRLNSQRQGQVFQEVLVQDVIQGRLVKNQRSESSDSLPQSENPKCVC